MSIERWLVPMSPPARSQTTAKVDNGPTNRAASGQNRNVETRASPTRKAGEVSSRLGDSVRPSSWSPRAGYPPAHPPQEVGARKPAGGGFYIPPPGYQARSTSHKGPQRDADSRPAAMPVHYGGHGVWKPLGSGEGVADWIPVVRNEHRMHDIFSRLVHSDWNIPQAQRVL